MRHLDRLAAWRTAARRESEPPWRPVERARKLRDSYLEHLNEEPLSLDERVAHHLFHLMLYWRRWIAFIDLARATSPGREAEIAGDLMVMVQVGTELSDADVREYCRERGDVELLEAWTAYEQSHRAIREGAEAFTAAARRADARFTRVDELRKTRGLLHHFENERGHTETRRAWR